MIKNRLTLLHYAAFHGNAITNAQAYEILGARYYANGKHYVNLILYRMVKSGFLVRVSRGLYAIAKERRPLIVDPPNQTKLF